MSLIPETITPRQLAQEVGRARALPDSSFKSPGELSGQHVDSADKFGGRV